MGRNEIVETLLKSTSIDLNAVDDFGNNALMHGINKKFKEK
jgi:hypothetical protein